ncbi:ABC transporter permease subunit, partial [Staphylococcus aureus]|uniref:ABC transporter permease subunit n=1 Tax=Staphylococcus aureus TaxID=1280 RepID=UPI00210DF745
GQTEAAYSIGITYRQTIQRIILPHAIRVSIPARGNTFLSLIKDTSLLGFILAAEVRGKKASKNKRPSQLSDLNGIEDPSLLLNMIEQQPQQRAILLKIAQPNDVIADKDQQPIINAYACDKKVNATIEKRTRQETTQE